MSSDPTSSNILSLSSFSSNFPNVGHQLALKLTSSNFLLWQTQLLPLLHGYNLMKYIDGSLPPSKFTEDKSPNS